MVPIIAMVSFAVLSEAVYAVLPLLVGATVDRLGFTSTQAGLIGAADMFGATASALIISLILARGGWRSLMFGGLALLAVADACSGLAQHFPSLLISRIVAGLGEGTVLTIAYISMGETRNPVRAYGLATTGYVAYSAPALYCMPFLVATIALRGVFWGLAALTICAMLLVKHLPDRARQSGTPAAHRAGIRLSTTSWIGLAGVVCYFMAQGGVWAYLDQIGLANHLSTSDVATALAISSIGGLLGALLATGLDSRYGRLRPLLYSTLCTLVSLFIMNENRTFAVFAAMASSFNGAWNFSVPYQFGALALIDPSRRTVALGGAVLNAGLAGGPVVAAAAIGYGGIHNVGWMGMVFSVLSWLLFARILLRAERAPIPSVAAP